MVTIKIVSMESAICQEEKIIEVRNDIFDPLGMLERLGMKCRSHELQKNHDGKKE